MEQPLSGLSSYLVRTAVLHAFDSAIDLTPRWQRHSVVAAFADLVDELAARLAAGNLPHFFFRRHNLLDDVPRRNVVRWRDRLRCLSSNRNEVDRVLRRRAHELTSCAGGTSRSQAFGKGGTPCPGGSIAVGTTCVWAETCRAHKAVVKVKLQGSGGSSFETTRPRADLHQASCTDQ